MNAPRPSQTGRLAFGIGLSLLLAALAIAGLNELTKPAPDFDLPRLGGGRLALSDLRGKVVLLNFWASWCAPCREEMPDLEAAYQSHKGDGFVVVGVNVYETAEQAQAFADEMGVTFPIVLDQDAKVADSMGVSGLPVSLLLDAEGRMVQRKLGQLPPETLDAWLAAALGKP